MNSSHLIANSINGWTTTIGSKVSLSGIGQSKSWNEISLLTNDFRSDIWESSWHENRHPENKSLCHQFVLLKNLTNNSEISLSLYPDFNGDTTIWLSSRNKIVRLSSSWDKFSEHLSSEEELNKFLSRLPLRLCSKFKNIKDSRLTMIKEWIEPLNSSHNIFEINSDFEYLEANFFDAKSCHFCLFLQLKPSSH